MQARAAALAVVLGLALPAPGASAQNLAGNQVGAAIAAPYFTGSVEGDIVTSVVVTNALASAGDADYEDACGFVFPGSFRLHSHRGDSSLQGLYRTFRAAVRAPSIES